MQSIRVTLPLSVTIGRSRVSMSRNRWENLHFRQKTKVKEIIRELVYKQVILYAALGESVSVSSVLYVDRLNCDLGNFNDVLLKICSDCLVKAGIIKDDNVKIIKTETRIFGGVDKLNPRLEVTYTTTTGGE